MCMVLGITVFHDETDKVALRAIRTTKANNLLPTKVKREKNNCFGGLNLSMIVQKDSGRHYKHQIMHTSNFQFK